MRLDGLHHVTAITADVDSKLGIYGRLLGLRLIWQGVNADDPGCGTSPMAMRYVAIEGWQPGPLLTGFALAGALAAVMMAWSTRVARRVTSPS